MEWSPDGGEFARIVGRRATPAAGSPPSEAARAAMTAMARYRTRVPKGVFIYRSHDEANRDRDRWIVDAMVEARRVG
jgi:hypothetical protein